MRFMTERERQEHNARLFSSVRVVRAAVVEKPKQQVQELAESSARLLIAAALSPAKRLLELYSELGLHAAEGKAALNELIARGMVRPVRLIRKGRGGQPTVLEVLAPGVRELQKRGIKPAAKLITRGSFKHDIYGREVAAHFRQERCRSVSFEKQMGEKCFDLLVESAEGSLLGIEICLSGSAKVNVTAGLKAAAVEGVGNVWLCFEDRKLLKAVENELREADALGLYRDKLRLEMLSEFVRV